MPIKIVDKILDKTRYNMYVGSFRTGRMTSVCNAMRRVRCVDVSKGDLIALPRDPISNGDFCEPLARAEAVLYDQS